MDTKEWEKYDKSKLYMADLESGLHYLLRIELATHRTLEGAALKTFKDFVILLAKGQKVAELRYKEQCRLLGIAGLQMVGTAEASPEHDLSTSGVEEREAKRTLAVVAELMAAVGTGATAATPEAQLTVGLAERPELMGSHSSPHLWKIKPASLELAISTGLVKQSEPMGSRCPCP
ncbi:UNVERIFIED_CONTAM: hypothetical protein K2H54_049252 [Gekko kuhli]